MPIADSLGDTVRRRSLFAPAVLVLPVLVLALLSALILVPAGTHPVTAATGTGQFEIRDGRILAPDGNPFVPVGTNMNGPNSFFDVPSKGLAATLAERWKFNTVRLVTCLPGGCQGGNATTNNDLEGIVAEFAARKIVVMIDYHQLDIAKAATDADIASAVTFWRDMARRFKGNPYVWFNLFNEPEATFNDFSGAPGTAAQRWRRQHQTVLDAVRAEGAPNVVVMDDTQAGQGAADWWQIGQSPEADSGIMSEGANIVDPVKRTVFSVHAYDVWGFPNDGSTPCTNRYSDEQRDARFRSYVERIQSKGLVLLVGEVGFRPQDQLTSGLSDHGERFGQQPPCGSTQRLAAETVYRVAPALGVGVLTWHGYALVNEGPQAFTLTGDPPGNLTRMGQLQFAYAQGLAAGTPATPPPTAIDGGVTATTVTGTEDTIPSVAPTSGSDGLGRAAVVIAILAALVASFGLGVLFGRRKEQPRPSSRRNTPEPPRP